MDARVPVTWYNFVKIENNNLSISLEIINYLKEFINFALKKDFVIIIDMHHDDHTWLNIAGTEKEFKKVKLQYKHIWEIVAREFKNYNENLIFEGMNEIIDRSDSNHSDWWGHNKILFKRLNILYKTFVKTVRKFSMLNKKRTLMISTYGAQIHHNALKHFKMVKDKNIIVDLHHYSIKKDNSYFIEKFEPTFKYLINKNIPIFLGEVGVKKEFIQDFDYIKNYLEFLNLHHIKFALWDNGSDRSFINRETAKFSCNKIKDLLTKN